MDCHPTSAAVAAKRLPAPVPPAPLPCTTDRLRQLTAHLAARYRDELYPRSAAAAVPQPGDLVVERSCGLGRAADGDFSGIGLQIAEQEEVRCREGRLGPQLGRADADVPHSLRPGSLASGSGACSTWSEAAWSPGPTVPSSVSTPTISVL